MFQQQDPIKHLRILQVATVASTLRAFLLPFATHFQQLGWEVDAMGRGVSQCSKCCSTFGHVFDITWSRRPFSPYNFINSASLVRKVVNFNGYDIVHCHTPVAAFLTRFALRGTRTYGRTKVIYTAHGFHFHNGSSDARNTFFLSLEKLAGRWTDRLIVINHEDEEAAQFHKIVSSDRITYSPGIGVDTTQYSPSAVDPLAVGALRHDLGLSSEDSLFLMIAEFIPRKRHRDLIRALGKLENTKVHVAFAGTGSLMGKLLSLSRKLKLEQRVHFLGQREDIPVLIQASVATILPSTHEGLPRSILESMAMGVPVIGTNIRGITELLADGCGILIPVGDVSGIADAIDRMLVDPVVTKAMGRRCRNRVLSYDVRKVLRLHESIYRKTMEQ